MNSNDIIDLASPQWQDLYKVIYEILPPLTTEVELDVFESSSRYIDPMKLREKTAEELFPDREALYHVSNHVNTFMIGAWWPLVERETFCAIFVGQDNKLYYIGDSSFATDVLEIPETEWTVLNHHIPIAPVTTYYQLMAFLMFFTGDDSMPSVKVRLEELIDAWSGLSFEKTDPVQMEALAEAIVEHYETPTVIPLTNLERLQQLAADMVDSGVDVVQEQSRTGKTVIAGSVVGLMALAGYGLYRAFRG
mgnify:CR=1 FL=1